MKEILCRLLCLGRTWVFGWLVNLYGGAEAGLHWA